MSIGEMALAGLIAGIVVGLLPLGIGFWKDRVALGVVGFVASALSGIVLGLLLAIPVAVVFTLAIVLMRPERRTRATHA